MGYVFSQSDRELILREGIIDALKIMVTHNRIPRDVASDYLSGWLGAHTLLKLTEAEKEITHLSGVISRLKLLCSNIDRDHKIQFGDARIGQYKYELKTFDGWTVSLLETVLSIISITDPKKATMKSGEIQTAFSGLMTKRATELHPFLKDPSQFKKYVS